MQVVVRIESLVPRMQHRGETDLPAEGLLSKLQQCISGRREQQVQQQPLVVLAPEEQDV